MDADQIRVANAKAVKLIEETRDPIAIKTLSDLRAKTLYAQYTSLIEVGFDKDQSLQILLKGI